MFIFRALSYNLRHYLGDMCAFVADVHLSGRKTAKVEHIMSSILYVVSKVKK